MMLKLSKSSHYYHATKGSHPYLANVGRNDAKYQHTCIIELALRLTRNTFFFLIASRLVETYRKKFFANSRHLHIYHTQRPQIFETRKGGSNQATMCTMHMQLLHSVRSQTISRCIDVLGNKRTKLFLLVYLQNVLFFMTLINFNCRLNFSLAITLCTLSVC